MLTSADLDAPVLICLEGGYALEAVSDSLRRELHGQGVDVILIEPGGVKTPIWKKSHESAKEIETRRKAFLRKWRLKCQAVADSLEEAGEALFAFTRLPSSQWKSARTTNAIERLHAEFKRRIKTQTVLPSAETAAMLFWALLASGQISMRKVDGWQSLGQPPAKSMIDLAA